jgi:signal transduction histidine kinase
MRLPLNLRVYVDPDRILQALLNLLSNAAKFAPSGTTVEVAVTAMATISSAFPSPITEPVFHPRR